MPLSEHLQLVLLELKRQKKESFPDHICAQANRVMVGAGTIADNANIIKYYKDTEEPFTPYLKQSLISTMATCLRMLEELEK